MIGLILLLVIGVVTQSLFQIGRKPSPTKLDPQVISASVAGVESKDLDIAGTESVSKAIAEGLGFSDYRYREYRRGGVQFTVYLAYWQDRQRHFMDLGTHAPDNCWVSSGWKMDPKLPKRAFELGAGSDELGAGSDELGAGSLELGAKSLELEAKSLELVAHSSKLKAHSSNTWPGESRIFQANGETIHVVYWHLLNGQPLDYTRYGTGKTMGYLMDNLGYYWRGTGEQYFLRVSSNRPVGEWQADPTFQAILTSLIKHMPLGGNLSR